MTIAKRTLAAHGGLLNPNWKYVPSCQTDIRTTFAAARRGSLGEPVRTSVVKGGSV